MLSTHKINQLLPVGLLVEVVFAARQSFPSSSLHNAVSLLFPHKIWLLRAWGRNTVSTSPVKWSPTGKARGTSVFFGGIRRSIPSYPQGFGGLFSSHSSTAIGRGLLRRRIKYGKPPLLLAQFPKNVKLFREMCYMDKR